MAIAGSSIGALAGAVYAAGMTGKEIRRLVIRSRASNRGVAAIDDGALRPHRRLFQRQSVSHALDAEKLTEAFLPETVPNTFEALAIPLTIVASDLHRRHEVVSSTEGPLRPALAASIALPMMMRPVVAGERVLIDGGATNPLPFDLLRGCADVVMAVDVVGIPAEDHDNVPGNAKPSMPRWW